MLNGYRWVDRNKNIVRIPVADAMKLTLQRGLPARQQAAAGGSGNTGHTGKRASERFHQRGRAL